MRSARLAAAVVAAALAAGTPVAAGAAPSPRGTRPLVSEALGDLSPALEGVDVLSPAYRAALDSWEEAGTQLEEADGDLIDAEGRWDGLTAARDRLADELAADRRVRQAAAAAAEEARATLRNLAVASFVVGSDQEVRLTASAGLDDESDDSRREIFGGATEDATASTFAARERALADARAEEVATGAEMAEVEAARDAALAVLRQVRDERRGWARVQQEQGEAMVAAAPTASVAGTDLMVLVLDAYVEAARAAADLSGGSCAVPWPVLAGIGKVETSHGTYRGAAPDEHGDVRPLITGIPLNGANGTAIIGDSDRGLLDGDPTVDRAVGPMQFIPSTWMRWRTDGDGDGDADPHNLYDAAATSARYLCQTRGTATLLESWRGAVLSYNHSDAYVARVLGLAVEYAGVGLGA